MLPFHIVSFTQPFNYAKLRKLIPAIKFASDTFKYPLKLQFSFSQVPQSQPTAGANVINKFQSGIITLLRNKALWLDVASLTTSFIQSECIIWEYSSYVTLYFVYNIGSWRREMKWSRFWSCKKFTLNVCWHLRPQLFGRLALRPCSGIRTSDLRDQQLPNVFTPT